MICDTSIEAWETVKASGKLNNLQLWAYKFVIRNPGCTELDAEKECPGIRRRFSELKRMNLIVVNGCKKQEGFRRNTHVITGNTTPAELPKKNTYKEICAFLQSENARLYKLLHGKKILRQIRESSRQAKFLEMQKMQLSLF